MGKIYFASDFHLGAPSKTESKVREACIIRWLDTIKSDADAIYLVGDLFDFWFEYKTAVPRGFVRFLGKLAELKDSGIPIYVFTGNHDLWMFNYFEEELGIPVYRQPLEIDLKGKKFFIGHGDGLGPGDYGYKRMKKIFTNRFFQWCFSLLHPNIGIGTALFWSQQSRSHQPAETEFLGEDKEWLMIYANKKLDTYKADFFVFGHRHLPIDVALKNKTSRYINLGEWLNYNSYAVFDGDCVELKYFEK